MRKFGATSKGPSSAFEQGGGAGSQTEADAVIRFASIESSSLSKRTGAVQLSVVGIAGLDYESASSPLADDSKAEVTDDAEQYGSLGIIGRPLRGTVDMRANVACIATADGLVPIAARDLRLKMGGNGPGEGVLAFVGYGGGFHSLTPVAAGNDLSGAGTLHVIYCPYDYQDGVPQRAHAITLNPTPGNESIIIAHGNGLAITMSDQGKKALLLKNAAGDATLRLDDDGIVMTAKKIDLAGVVSIGNVATAQPILAGVATLASTSLRYSSPA